METIKTVNDLRTMLAEEIQKLRNHETDPRALNALVNASGKILISVKMEIEYNKHQGKTAMIPFIESTAESDLPSPNVRAIKA
jgi:hypothetical protein